MVKVRVVNDPERIRAMVKSAEDYYKEGAEFTAFCALCEAVRACLENLVLTLQTIGMEFSKIEPEPIPAAAEDPPESGDPDDPGPVPTEGAPKE